MPGEVARHKINFAFRYLKFAAYNAKICGEIEEEHGKSKTLKLYFNEGLKDKLASHCISCLWFCNSSLESYISEVFQSRMRCFSEVPQNYFEIIYGAMERKNVIEKLDSLLKIKDKAIDASREPWQSLKLMIDVRNSLIHFNPEWSDDNGEHKRLVKRLDSFKLKPKFYQNPGIDSWYPLDYFGYKFSEWAVQVTMNVYASLEVDIKYFGDDYAYLKQQVTALMK